MAVGFWFVDLFFVDLCWVELLMGNYLLALFPCFFRLSSKPKTTAEAKVFSRCVVKKSPGQKHEDVKKIIAAELQDGDVVELVGAVQGEGYKGDDSQEVGVEDSFFGQGFLER